MYHTTTKSYTFKTRVITIFVHSAAAPRKNKNKPMLLGEMSPAKPKNQSHKTTKDVERRDNS